MMLSQYKIFVLLFFLICLKQKCNSTKFDVIDKQFYLVSEAYDLAKNLFDQGAVSYKGLKTKALHAIDTFLDLVQLINERMANELRIAVLKFYKIKYLHDFTNYIISMEDIIDIVEHCLSEPAGKLIQVRDQFHHVVSNFQDARNFGSVDNCHKQLPDEVATAHCLLHQAVLFNETMEESLVTIVQIKTRQHAEEMRTSLYGVHKCINIFVPKFYEQLLLDAYTPKSSYLRVVNASVSDLIKDKWKGNETTFPLKWSPLVKLLKETKPENKIKESILAKYLPANVTM